MRDRISAITAAPRICRKPTPLFHDPSQSFTIYPLETLLHGKGRFRRGFFAANERPMPGPAADVVRRLAEHAEAVCRHYLSNGCRSGRYWQVGDVANTPGRSLYVRLFGPSAGKWVDAATGEHGDLLDLIALNRNLPTLKDALDEARRFLALPQPQPPLKLRCRARDLGRGGAAAVRHGAADRRHHRRGLSLAPRYHRCSPSHRAALPPELLLSRSRRSAPQGRTGADRCRDRYSGPNYRRPAHMARSVRVRQGPDRHADAGPSEASTGTASASDRPPES